MSEDKDDLMSIKIYKFNNMKEGWHEFAFKFRVIADSRGYDDIIEGTETHSESSTTPFLSFSFITSMAPSYSDCGREFNKWVINVSSSILCPGFANYVHFFSRKAN